MKRYKLGYIAGVFDLFHVGHLNILRAAKNACDYLIVGVNSDELVETYKNRRPIIPLEERCEIVKAIHYVDEVIPLDSRDKIEAWKTYQFDVVFSGDDWKFDPLYLETEQRLKALGVDLIYFPYTKGTSSTVIRKVLMNNIMV